MKTTDENNTIKHDLILLSVFVLIAVILILIMKGSDKTKGEYVLITLDGKEYARVSLLEDTVLNIDSDKGRNTVVVSDKEVYVEYSRLHLLYYLCAGQQRNHYRNCYNRCGRPHQYNRSNAYPT